MNEKLRDAGPSVEADAKSPTPEDDSGQGGAIEASVCSEHPLSVRADDVPPAGLPRLHDGAGQYVGVQHDSPAILKQACDGAFSGGETTRETGHDHEAG